MTWCVESTKGKRILQGTRNDGQNEASFGSGIEIAGFGRTNVQKIATNFVWWLGSQEHTHENIPKIVRPDVESGISFLQCYWRAKHKSNYARSLGAAKDFCVTFIGIKNGWLTDVNRDCLHNWLRLRLSQTKCFSAMTTFFPILWIDFCCSYSTHLMSIAWDHSNLSTSISGLSFH